MLELQFTEKEIIEMIETGERTWPEVTVRTGRGQADLRRY